MGRLLIPFLCISKLGNFFINQILDIPTIHIKTSYITKITQLLVYQLNLIHSSMSRILRKMGSQHVKFSLIYPYPIYIANCQNILSGSIVKATYPDRWSLCCCRWWGGLLFRRTIWRGFLFFFFPQESCATLFLFQFCKEWWFTLWEWGHFFQN